MIKLTPEQSFQIMYERSKRNKRLPKTATRLRWYCLNCLKEIYVPFNDCSLKAIYCEDCKKEGYGKRSTNNIVEVQYLRKLKETQFKHFQKFLDSHDI